MRHDHKTHCALLLLVPCATLGLGGFLSAAEEGSPPIAEVESIEKTESAEMASKRIASKGIELRLFEPRTKEPAAPDQDLAFDIERLPFERLDFKAKKLLWTATASLAVEVVGQKSASDRLIPVTQGFEATSPTLRLDVGSGFLGRNSLSEVWLAPGSAQALQRVQTETGKRRRRKIYRFSPRTVFATRITPSESQPDEQDPERWKQKSDTEYPLKIRSVVVTDPSALFLILTTAPDNWLDRPRVIHTFSKNELHRVQVTSGEPREIPVNYIEVRGQSETPVRGSRKARVVLLEPLPGPDGQTGDMQLLGLEGNIQLYLDAETRIPLQISGRIPPAGSVHIKLTRFQPANVR